MRSAGMPWGKGEGVSEVIGTLILVGMVILGMVIVGIVLLSQPQPGKMPVLDTLISNDSRTIYLYHKGGDPLLKGEYLILVDGENRTLYFNNSGGLSSSDLNWSVGQTLFWTASAMPARVAIVYTTTGGGSGGGGGGSGSWAGGNVIATQDLTGAVVLPPQPLNNGWFNYSTPGNCSWKYRKSITISGSQVAGTSSLSGFPVLISLTSDPELNRHARTDGYDILFTAVDGTTQLPHEIESYSSGTLVAWVKVATLTPGTNTVIYMYYGNTSGTTPQQNPAGVWDSNFVVVQHMNGSSYSTVDDSTSNHNDFSYQTGAPSFLQAGQVGTAVSFDGSDDSLEIYDPGAGSTLDLTSQVTTCAWIRPTDIDDWERIVTKSHDANHLPYSEYGLLFDDDTHIRGEIASSDTQYEVNGATTIPLSTWSYACARYNHSYMSIYLNGTPDGTPVSRSSNIDTNNMNLSIGRSGFNDDYYTGMIDEVRVSGTSRSDGWIKTEYNNMKSPSAFSSVGSEEQYYQC